MSSSTPANTPRGIEQSIWDNFTNQVGPDIASQVSDIFLLDSEPDLQAKRLQFIEEAFGVKALYPNEQPGVGAVGIPLNVNSADILGKNIPILVSSEVPLHSGGKGKSGHVNCVMRIGGFIKLEKVSEGIYTFTYNYNGDSQTIDSPHEYFDKILSSILSTAGNVFVDGSSYK